MRLHDKYLVLIKLGSILIYGRIPIEQPIDCRVSKIPNESRDLFVAQFDERKTKSIARHGRILSRSILQ